MPIRGIEYAVDQIVAVLQANLPAELDLVQSITGLDAIPNGLEDIAADEYFKFRHNAALVEKEHAVLVLAEGMNPLTLDSITNSPGRLFADYDVTVEVHLKDAGNEQPHVTQSRVTRYALAIIRVLSIKNPTLNGTVFFCLPGEKATFTPVTQQGDDEAGEYVGSARIPFTVRMDERL